MEKDVVGATESSLKTGISSSNTRRIAFARGTADHLLKNINSINFSFLSLQQKNLRNRKVALTVEKKCGVSHRMKYAADLLFGSLGL